MSRQEASISLLGPDFEVVTKAKFYATIGLLNVTPYPSERWSSNHGYLTLWKLPSGEVVGKSIGSDTTPVKNTYALGARWKG